MTKQITLTLDKDTIETLVRSAYGVPTDPPHKVVWDVANARIIVCAETQEIDKTKDHPHVTGV
jgi:hypothetical protein